jgi:hypothetical protein
MIKITHIPATEEEAIAKRLHKYLMRATGLYFQVSTMNPSGKNILVLKRTQGR